MTMTGLGACKLGAVGALWSVAAGKAVGFTFPVQKTRSPSSASFTLFETVPVKGSLEAADGATETDEPTASTTVPSLVPLFDMTENSSSLTEETASGDVLDWDVGKSADDGGAVVKAVIETALADPSSSSTLPIVLRPVGDSASASVMESPRDEIDGEGHERMASAPLATDTLAKSETAPRAPTTPQILRFAIPAIGIWMCGPLLSMIDTASVGVFSGTAQQAALSPAVAVTDYSANFVAFMYTATTNLVASSLEAAPETRDSSARTSIEASLQLSTFVGLALGGILFAFSRPLLRVLTGAIDPNVFAASLRYVRIRSLGAPAAVLIGSAQSASLGMQDLRSPLGVLLMAAVVNCLGDLLFVPHPNPWLGGAAGAGWATVISQYVAAALFLRWLVLKPKFPRKDHDAAASSSQPTPAPRRLQPTASSVQSRTKSVDLTASIHELVASTDQGGSKSRQDLLRQTLRSSSATSSSNRSPPVLKRLHAVSNLLLASRKKRKPARNPTSTPTTRGILAGFSPSHLMKLPPFKMVKKFLPYVIPVSTASFGKISIYVAMNHVVASTMGTTAMAAQQIVLSFFSCLTPVADSLSQTGQAYLPGIYQQPKGWARTAALRKATFNFWKAGGLFGAILALAVSSIPLISVLFTTDPLVVATASTVAPLMAWICFLQGFFNATEGLLLGQRDLGFLGKIYAIIFVAAPLFVLRVKQASSPTLRSVWQVLFYYQFLRVGSFVWRSWMVQRRTERQQLEEATSALM